jgi:hypothetical protein
MEVDAKVPLSRLSCDMGKNIIDLSKDEHPQVPSIPSIARKFTAPAIVKQVLRQEVVQSKPKDTTPLYVTKGE